jgi:hypothetical protein
MARKIYIKNGGLSSSDTTPEGYTALGSDSGVLKVKVEDTITSVGGGSGGNVYKTYTALINQTTTELEGAKIGEPTPTLEIGKKYFIPELGTDDDFTNVGYVSPVGDDLPGVFFIATETTPNVWVNTSVISVDDSQPTINVLEDGILLDDAYFSPIYVTSSRPDILFDVKNPLGKNEATADYADATTKGGYKYAIVFEKEGGFPINRTFVYPAWNNSSDNSSFDRRLGGYYVFRKDDSSIILYYEGEVLDNTQVEFKVYFDN